MSKANDRTHEYHAEAEILSGDLRLPLVQKIEKQARVHLPSHGGYLSEHAGEFRIEGVLRYRRGYTQVAGNPSTKPGHGPATLVTTVVEGLNILEVLTADRVVGQILTEHPLDGYVPHISFLGTRFENLRVAGHPVELDLDLNILGPKPAHDAPYTTHHPVMERVKKQYRRIHEREDLPADLKEIYNQLSSKLGAPEAVECSLVNQATGGYPGISFGHVIRIPDFGTIYLARLKVTHEGYEATEIKPDAKTPEKTIVTLTMVDLKLGCAIEGNVPVATGSSNGMPAPPPPGS